MRSLTTAATGMQAQQLQIDVIANNLANVNTDGYKQTRAEFQDLMYQTMRVSGAASSASTTTTVGLQVGLGVRPSATVRNFDGGTLKATGSNLDVAINGEGFLQIQLPTGEIAYTRNGSLHVNDEGRLTTSDGYLLEPPVTLPTNTNDDQLTIGADGTITVRSVDDNRSTDLGRIRLARFVNKGGLEALGNNLYRSNGDTRSIREGYPTEDGFGSIQQGYLESSNVKVVEEMIAMITGQRAYEASSKVIQAADRMLEQANQLR